MINERDNLQYGADDYGALMFCGFQAVGALFSKEAVFGQASVASVRLDEEGRITASAMYENTAETALVLKTFKHAARELIHWASTYVTDVSRGIIIMDNVAAAQWLATQFPEYGCGVLAEINSMAIVRDVVTHLRTKTDRPVFVIRRWTGSEHRFSEEVRETVVWGSGAVAREIDEVTREEVEMIRKFIAGW